jgi:putative effector of murein hydrolase LrgA (UPF0299 family)
MKELLGILLVAAFLILCGNAIITVRATPGVGYVSAFLGAIPGMLILIAFAVAGVLCKRYIPIKLPAAAYIVTIGCLLSIPGAPGSTSAIANLMNETSSTIMHYVGKISFMSLTTPVLAYAGLSLAKDLDALKESGWKIVVVALFVFVGTFVGSAAIADLVLRMTGQI